MTCSLPIDRYADQEYRLAITKGRLSEGGPQKIFTTSGCAQALSNIHRLGGFDNYRPMNLIIGDHDAFQWIDTRRFLLFKTGAERDQLLERLGRFSLSPMQSDDGSESKTGEETSDDGQ